MQPSTDLGDIPCTQDGLRAHIRRSDDYAVDVDGTVQDRIDSTDFDDHAARKEVV
jgi:hypothetical protein